MKYKDESKLEQCQESVDRMYHELAGSADKELTDDQFCRLGNIYDELVKLENEVITDES